MVMESLCVLSNCPFEMDNGQLKCLKLRLGSRFRGPLQTSGRKTIVSFSEFFFFLFFFLILVPFFEIQFGVASLGRPHVPQVVMSAA